MNIGKEFIEKTKYKYAVESDQQLQTPQPALELPYDADCEVITLPSILGVQFDNISLRLAIEKRESLRTHDLNASLTLNELTYLLWATQGVRKELIPDKRVLRNVPSAGCRHAFETYLLINRVEGLKKGLYRYVALENILVFLCDDNELDNKITECCLGQKFILTSAVTFIWSAVPYRMTWRYGERGYRYLYLDAGHVCQNLYLASEDINCGTCAIDAFDDDSLNKLLEFDGENQFAIYVATVGRRV